MILLILISLSCAVITRIYLKRKREDAENVSASIDGESFTTQKRVTIPDTPTSPTVDVVHTNCSRIDYDKDSLDLYDERYQEYGSSYNDCCRKLGDESDSIEYSSIDGSISSSRVPTYVTR